MFSLRLLFAKVALLLAVAERTLTNKNDASVFTDTSKNPYNIKDYREHPCRRDCKAKSLPMTCHYYFLVENFATMSAACHNCPRNVTECFLPQCVPGDGRERGILTVNRMLPGPVIDVCRGDELVVSVDNRMLLGEGTSIHWHGVRQIGSPHMDGTSLITQCPINANTIMTYRFTASDPGTHFWHSHSSLQRSEGFFGGLVIREPYNLDPHRHLFDYDLPEHYILLIDWGDKTVGEVFAQEFHANINSKITGILVNGIGTSKAGPQMPFPVFKVKAGKRYRFRFAYNGIYNCPLYITVDGHSVVMIATDGRNFEPLDVDGFFIFSGERYDFILNAKQGVKDNFWIRFKGYGKCLDNIIQAAILRYEGAEDKQPKGIVTYNNTVESDSRRILNGLTDYSTKTSYKIADLQLLGTDDDADVLTRKPDKQFYISAAASKLVDERFKPPLQPNRSTAKPPPVRTVNHQFNYISSLLPPSPPLSQFEDIPKELFCNNKTVTEQCSQVLCLCIHLLTLDTGDIVELVLVSFTNTAVHPLHMHGHTFRVVAMHSFFHDVTIEEVKSMDRKGKIPRRKSKAPYKDTVAVHAQSVVIIRFRANNPGFWFFHCHIEFHAELGMSLILQSGKPHQMPKPPQGFPTCGSWRPEWKKFTKINGSQQLIDADTSNGEGSVMLGAVIVLTGVVVIVLVVVTVVCKREHQKAVLYRPARTCGSVSYKSLM